MYAKIALGNVRKSFRDFAVFFLTLAFGVCVFYAFGSINDQAAVIGLAEDERTLVETLVGILNGLTVFVVIILGFLVVYANRFLIRRRKREFGIYLTLGMDIRHVSWIIVIETLTVGLGALAVGLALGVALSQVMMYVTAGLFEATISGFVFAFSPSAALATVACFAGIFLVTLVFNVGTVSRYRLIDLINADRVSERVTLRSLPLSVALFVVSVALIGVAYATLLEHGMMEEGPYFALATGLVTVGTLLLFFSISGFALRALQASPRAYLSGLNMFVMRQLNSRINTAWLSISLVCAMLFLAICGVCTGFSVASGVNDALRLGTRYDMSLVSYPTGMLGEQGTDGPAAADGYDAIARMRADIPEFDELFRDAVQVNQYQYDADGRPLVDVTVEDIFANTDFSGNATMQTLLQGNTEQLLTVVPVSEYNELARMLGEKDVELADGECLLWNDMPSLDELWEAACAQNGEVTACGQTLRFAEEPLASLPFSDTGAGGTVSGALIVNDDVIPEGLGPAMTAVNLMYNGERAAVEPAATAAIDEAYDDVMGTGDTLAAWPVWNAVSAQSLLDSSAGTTVVVTYLAIYIGVILLVSCATVLALQQLSEAVDNVGRYRVLAELGAERRMIDRALFAQIAVYFLFPLVVAVAHASVALSVVNDIVELLTGFQIGTALVGTVCFVVALYGGYFVVTYLTSRSMIVRSGGAPSRRS
ncbi:FtsX-like permease family protein [Olsenella profusa]|uniref:ABC transporter permease n=1 Tax=Olsenella profusa TaxID=138595 RepID=A0ABS2F3M3_9ACTN|nr:ABC transporter permease [Olsenella profusa]MBM6775606.1 ABC transporter permease [Olsenella profusa]